MTNPQDLEQLKRAAEHTLRNLTNLLAQSPELTAEVKALMSADDQVQEYTSLVLQKPRVAEQILRMSLATLGNLQLADEIGRQLAQNRT